MNRFIFSLLLLSLSRLVAQEPSGDVDAVYPAATRALELPAKAAWSLTLTLASAQSDEGKLAHATTISSTRLDNIQRDEIAWSDGKKSESWWIDKVWLAEDPKSEGLLFHIVPWPAKRLGITAWAKRENFKGLQTIDGKEYLVFEDTLSLTIYWPGYVIPDGSSKLAVAAYISTETGKLVKVKLGDWQADITWVEDPAQELNIPPKFAQKYDIVKRAFKSKFVKATGTL